MDYANFELEQIREYITANQNVPVCLKLLQKFIQQNNLTAFLLRWEQINSDYLLMKNYMKRGVKDPQFSSVYHDLLRSLYALNSDIQLAHLVKENSSYKVAQQVAQNITLEDELVKQRLEAFVQDITMLSLLSTTEREEKEQNIYNLHQEYLNALFNAIFVSPQWTESVAHNIKQLLLSPTIDTNDAQLLLSAITLSIIQLFDVRKFVTLFDIYNNSTDPYIAQRALVALVLALPETEGNIYPEINKVITTLCNNQQTVSDLIQLQMQFFYCIKADADNEKLQKDILPNLMRGSQIQITRAGIIDKEDNDALRDILQPNADEKDIEEMEQNYQKMMDMQADGSDIYFGGFSQMKRFSFFMVLSNWFAPFYIQHPDLYNVRKKLANNNLLKVMLNSGAFCNSDKYSFVLAMNSIIDKIPANVQEMLSSTNAIPTTTNTEDMKKPAFVRRMYLQDLYRFYRLYKEKYNFHNPFQTKLPYHTAFFILNQHFKHTALVKNALNIGRFLLKQHFYNELQLLLDAYPIKEDIDYLQLTAKLAFQEKDYLNADVAFDKILQLQPDSQEAMRGKAATAFYLEDYEQAAEYYSKVLLLNPQDSRIQLNLAVSYINNNQLETGMQYLFKLSYEHPQQLAIQRALAWGYLRTEKPQQAMPIYQKLIENPKHLPADLLNAGYCAWFLSQIDNAALLFAQYKTKNTVNNERNQHAFTSLHDVFILDTALLQQYHISKEEVCVMEDLIDDCLNNIHQK